ncbi:Protein of unknown function [Pyronema omphalodes CBS 100304]|uniref:Uncharacterized protein n=1 Tax=Pyronema omphalodes (strain CBS 100304) TaxID=1076935 RepID=U4LSF3_PYROM|nr:Protein of unknown function [Pyronema omphalodes CBS 100304]
MVDFSQTFEAPAPAGVIHTAELTQGDLATWITRYH